MFQLIESAVVHYQQVYNNEYVTSNIIIIILTDITILLVMKICNS